MSENSTPMQMLAILKGMGLNRFDRAVCMDVYRELGLNEARRVAGEILQRSANALHNAEVATSKLCGLRISKARGVTA